MSAVGNWFRTRWATLWWPFRATFAAVIILAAVTGNWILLLGVPGWFFIIADWQYWAERSRIEAPVARFGAAVAGDLHRAQERGVNEVRIRMVGDSWVMSRIGG